MPDAYRIVYRGGTGEIVEKKSRFIATVIPITSEEEALSFIEQKKKQYWDASHNCSAYTLGIVTKPPAAVMTESRRKPQEDPC